MIASPSAKISSGPSRAGRLNPQEPDIHDPDSTAYTVSLLSSSVATHKMRPIQILPHSLQPSPAYGHTPLVLLPHAPQTLEKYRLRDSCSANYRWDRLSGAPVGYSFRRQKAALFAHLHDPNCFLVSRLLTDWDLSAELDA